MTGAPRLRAVRIAADDVDRVAAFLATVCGSSTVAGDDGTIRLPIDDSALIVEPLGTEPGSVADRPGIAGVDVENVDREPASMRLNGVAVTTGPPGEVVRSEPADVIVDHVAIAVADLEQAARAWQAATGAPAELIGIHPVSGGAFRAARLALGPHMLELVSPVPGTTSAIASRMEQVGEGPMALALPAKDLDATRRRLEELAIPVVWRDPHWLVHPANPAGVLIQLTPRVAH